MSDERPGMVDRDDPTRGCRALVLAFLLGSLAWLAIVALIVALVGR